MFVRLLALLVASVVTLTLIAPSASAQPDPDPVLIDEPPPEVIGAVPAVVDEAPPELAPGPPQALPPGGPLEDSEAPPPDDGRVASSPPATTTTPDGWELTVSAMDETQRPIAPLTTAVSTREYEVGGVFNGTLAGPEEAESPQGILEVGYQIGCGIDMSTSNGVVLSGSIGATSGLTQTSIGAVPTILAPISGGIAVALKPGIVNIVQVTKKEFEGAEPWVMVEGFRTSIDGCVGESFIRSYAILTRETQQSEAVVAYYGVTKKV